MTVSIDSINTRRALLKALTSAGLLAAAYPFIPASATGNTFARRTETESADIFNLTIGKQPLIVDGQSTDQAITINGGIPAPLIRLREGRNVIVNVSNQLQQDTSIHWHGILLPYQMDGVPGISFAGIKPKETFQYTFPVEQSGTYWYHSHSGMQEQLGLYGPLIIDPIEPEPHQYQQDYTVVLSDWSFSSPHEIFRNLKVSEGYYNDNQRTVRDFFDDVENMGWQAAWQKSAMWGQMRMTPRDILDVTGAEYTYLMNGKASNGNWTGLFQTGQTVRLRFINASAMTFFDVKIPGLEMTVINADGMPVQPVKTDEFRLGVAETYDVLVTPTHEAYTLFAQSQDRSGFISGTLATRAGLKAAIPKMYPTTERGMDSMAMGHDMTTMTDMKPMADDMMHHDHHMMDMSEQKNSPPPATQHSDDKHGVGAAMVSSYPKSRLDDPGIGFETVTHKILTYSQLKSPHGWPDKRPPQRSLELHLTGNMERYMWSFDGKKFSEVDGPIRFYKDERLRLILVNDTMMDHPIHLHGMWMELENGHGDNRPRKHTIIVKPGEKLSTLITADAFGDWAFHCHLMYHMKAGMFRVVSVA